MSLQHRVALAALTIGLLASTRTLRVAAMDDYLATQRYEDVYYAPPPHWLKVFSLGYDEALADLLWLRALVYFGDEIVHHGEVRHVFEYTDAMLALDPDFKAVYHWAGTAGMYRPVEVSVADIRRSVAILERGARRFPDDGKMAWDAGASLCFELVPWIHDEAEKRTVMLRGLAYLETAARLGEGPDWLVFTTATELRHLGETDQAIQHLEEMYASVRDEETREEIERELAGLRGQSYAEAFRAMAERLEEHRLDELPYVPPELYILVGPRPPVDLDTYFPDEVELSAADEP